MSTRILTNTNELKRLILMFLLTCVTFSIAYAGNVSVNLEKATVREAIKALWQGAPEGATYQVDDSVSWETVVSLSIQNAPFNAALDSVCRAAGVKYRVDGNVYKFARDTDRVGTISIRRLGQTDRASVIIRDADPVDAAKNVCESFEKRYDFDRNQSPSEELGDLALQYSQKLQEIALRPVAEQGFRLKELKKEAERYIKPSKALPPGTRKSVSLEDGQITFTELMDQLAYAGGFLWFRRSDGQIVLRNTTSVEQVRDIFTRAGIWDDLQR